MAKKKTTAQITFEANTSQFDASIKKVGKEMGELTSEMKLTEAQMKATGNVVEGLEKKHKLLGDQQKLAAQKTEALKNKVAEAEKLFEANSDEAIKLRNQLRNAQTAEAKLQAKINDVNNELKEQKGATKGAGDGFTVFKGVVANLASQAITGAISKLSEFTGYLAQLPQETLEYRRQMGVLGTAFDSAGLSAKNAQKTYSDLYDVIGQEDQAVEASSLIARMCDDQEELAKWTEISTGVFAELGQSLPIESLAEASMEVSKTGILTGGLVDAINWAGLSEEEFQKKLDKCNTEQERQALITETLSDAYGESAKTYRETNKDVIAMNESNRELMETEAELSEAVQPVTAEFQGLKAELLEGAKPAVEAVSGVMLDALEWAKEHPTAVKAVGAAVGVLAIGFTGLAIAMGVYAAAQWAANLALMPFALPIAGIVVGIALLVGAGVALYKNWDKVTAKAKEFWKKVTTYFGNLKESAIKKFNELKTGIVNKFNDIKSSATSKVNSMKTGIVNKFESIKSGAISKFNALKNGIIKPIQNAKEKVSSIVKKIKGLFNFTWKLPKFKVPKINVKGGKAPWGILGKGTPPSFSIKWNAKGAIVKQPTIVGAVGSTLMGAGEAGAEAILPISVLQDYINRAFDRNVLSYAAAGGGGEVYNFYVNDARINDNAQMREVAKDFLTELVRLGGMNK